MALQVWLPLNGNLNNQGLSNVTVTNNGATVDNNGKIGKCYSFNGTNTFLSLNQCPFQGKSSFTLSMWCFPNTNSLNGLFGFQGGGYYQFAIAAETSGAYLGYRDNNTSSFTKFQFVSSIISSVWQHWTFTYDSGLISIYRNGEFLTSHQSDGNKMNSTINENYIGKIPPSSNVKFFNGKINDVRIYDHCLSPKEVKELSKGLILHYKLDDIVSVNLVSNSEKRINGQTSGNEYMAICDTFNIINTYGLVPYTVSFDIKAAVAHSFNIYGDSGANPKYTFTSKSISVTTEWQHISYTFTPRIYTESGTWARISVYGIYGSGAIVSVRHVKLELGSVETSFYDNNNMVYDCSGYKNNGTITGTLTIDSNSPRYNKCGIFSSSESNYITIPYNGIQGPYNNKELTFSFWINTQQSGNRHMIFGIEGSYNTNIELTAANKLRIYWAGTPDWQPGVDCTLNTWIHIGIVITSTYIKCYKNGVLIGTNTTSPSWAGCTRNLMIGSDQRIGTYFLGSKLSDFRIYSTVLSDSDVKELYDTSAYIDNHGNLECFEIDEANTSPKVNKLGITNAQYFIEFAENIKSLSDGSIWIKILHHNNPASNLFTVNNCWNYNDGNNLYSKLSVLKSSGWPNSSSEYEFLVCEKLQSSSNENQCRWKQTSNPATSSTLTGYTLISGSPGKSVGLMNKGTYGCFHNGGSWWCCCGSYTAYQGGIPGFFGTVTSGYVDLYIRYVGPIANIVDTIAKFYENSIAVNQILEY